MLLARRITRGGFCGSSPFHISNEGKNNMAKAFKTYNEQIELLQKKNLAIEDVDKTISLLKKYSYFTLINGYKAPFKDKFGNYKNKTSIDDIIFLYTFDDNIRHILMKYILKIELHIKSLISYSFCKKFEVDEAAYQNALNYNYTNANLQKPINDLIQILGIQLKKANQFPYMQHQADEHKNIPLWALTKALTFGNVSKMYACQKDSIKSEIAKEFSEVRENELAIMLDILTRYRNVCAHNERLYDFKYKDSRLKTTSYHQKFNLTTNNPVASNLFDVVIFLKCLLDEATFEAFVKDFSFEINSLSEKTNQIQKSQILKLMSFPQNWDEILKI